MTKPTQAQIEAAAKAMCEEAGRTDGVVFWDRFAKVGLTAAAEEGEPYVCALQTGKSGRRCIGWDNAIERCAQVAEDYIANDAARMIPDVIRELKSKL